MVTKTFAPQYPRDKQGWIGFPQRDWDWRKQLGFPAGVFEHPAKANLYLIDALVDYLTEPGDLILDPFGGTGSLIIATIKKRNVALLEIEQESINLQLLSARTFLDNGSCRSYKHTIAGNPIPDIVTDGEPWREPYIEIYQGDCRQLLPILCDAIITSPPYASTIKSKVAMTGAHEKQRDFNYDQSPLNMGQLNDFDFGQGMRRVYQGLYDSLPVGGPLCLLLKDRIGSKSERVMLSMDAIRMCRDIGFSLDEWFKWEPPGMATKKLAKSKGFNHVDDEDIIILRK